MSDASTRLPATGGKRLTPRSEGLMLGLDPGLAPAAALRRARRAVAATLPGAWEVTRLPRSGVFQVLRRPPSQQPLVRQCWSLARRLSAHPEVRWAEAAVIQPGHDPDPAAEPAAGRLRRPLGGGRRPSLACAREPEWSLANARLQEAFELLPSGPGRGVLVAHPDTGYTLHPEIHDPRLAVGLGYDYEDRHADPRDPLRGRSPGHGTATASVIMSAPGSPVGADTGVTGAAPAATLVPLRVSSGVVHFSFRRLVLAIERAIDLGSDVLSMSLGGPFASRALEQALQAAAQAGIIALAAAGNVWPWVVYPARSRDVIAVAASNCRDRVWRYSATGERVDLAAPGEDVWRAVAETRSRYTLAPGSGTSYAVATAAGAAALWVARHGREPLRDLYPGAALPSVFRGLLAADGVRRPDGWNTARHGAGILDARALLEAALPRRRPSAAQTHAHSEVNTPADVAHYFPDLDPDAVVALIAGLPGAAELGVEQYLARYGDELRFHLSVSTDFRRSLTRRGPRLAGPPAERLREHLGRYGSTEFRRQAGL